MSPELEKARIEHQERLHEELAERAKEQSPERQEQNAHHEALELAKSSEKERRAASQERQPSPAARRTGPISKAEREKSFRTTMNEVQSQMSAPSKTFSKVIHNPVVERTSELAGTTVARPNALLSGAIAAFILTLAVYLVARSIGYPLSGFESIGAFILGWILGIAYDFLKAMITGKR